MEGGGLYLGFTRFSLDRGLYPGFARFSYALIG